MATNPPNMNVVIGIDKVNKSNVFDPFTAEGMVDDHIVLFAVDALPEVCELIAVNSIYRATIWLDLDSIGEHMYLKAYNF